MPREYTSENGTFTFPGQEYQIQIHNIQRDRFGRFFCDVAVFMPDGVSYMALDHGDLSSGRFRAALAGQGAHRNSGDTVKIENLLIAAFLALRDDPDVHPASLGPQLLPIADFLRGVKPEGPHIVTGLLERGSLYGFASKPKVGKTLLLLNLAIAVATGQDWLGRRVQQGKVCVFQLEDSERSLKRRLEAMTNRKCPDDLWLHTKPFQLCADNYDATVSACRDALLVIVDPVIQAATVKDWNSQQEVRDAYDLWRRFSRDTNAGTELASHHRKMAGDFGDQMAGSIQAQATVDGIIELFRDPNLEKTERRVSFTGRDWSDREDEVIRLNTETLTWEATGSYQEAKETAKETRAQDKINLVKDALPSGPPGMTYDEIAATTGINSHRLSAVIKSMGDSVSRAGKGSGSKTDPTRFWRTSP